MTKHKTKQRTIAEYLVRRESLTGERVAEQLRQLKEAVSEAAALWDGKKLVGEPKKFQKFLNWSPVKPKKTKHSDRTPADERHYSPSELGDAWNLSTDTIRLLFEKEPGVLIYGDKQGSLYKYKLLISQFEEFATKKGIVYFSNLNLDNVREFHESWK